ncbi:conserved protein of unknown function [Pararobbsia alpina]|uniref:hypothetical protein n=1 Tax=Pararobbsia alpina TaxID=621374 RepID=UPI0039A75047
MKHHWEKLGPLFRVPDDGLHPLLLTHAANPLPVHLHDDVYRVFFSGRDKNNRSSVGAVDVDIVRRVIENVLTEPLFAYGALGSYYADGVSIGNVYEADGARFIGFMGWQTPPGQHWRGDIGRIRLTDNWRLEPADETPLMTSDSTDPVSLSYPWVMRAANGEYQMWYGSTLSWDSPNGEMIHVIKHATSTDGHKWQRHGLAVPYELGKAQAFSRPTVAANDDGSLDMWFSYRSGTGERYRIGYAHSADGKHWVLDLANAGIGVSPDGWDSEMIEYPYVFDHDGQRYMLYNGNAFGKSGFGLARLVRHSSS